jgi:hypothetical protein
LDFILVSASKGTSAIRGRRSVNPDAGLCGDHPQRPVGGLDEHWPLRPVVFGGKPIGVATRRDGLQR